MKADERKATAKRLWNAHEWFFLQAKLASEGRYAELVLLGTLRNIATGATGQRSAGESALKALEYWLDE